MNTTLGRFVMEEEGNVVRLRVRESEVLPVLRAVVIAAFLVSAVTPFRPALFIAWWILAIAVVGTGMVRGNRLSVRRSGYPRVRRLVEFARSAPVGVTVDGRAFPKHDFVGVVIAKSVEVTTLRYANTTTVKRVKHFVPTLVFRSALYELAGFEGADESDANELGIAIASAIAGSKVKPPTVDWSPSQYTSLAIFGVALVLETAAFVEAQVLAASLPPHPRPATLALALVVVVNVASTALIGHFGGRERSFAAMDLLAAAKKALGHPRPDP